MKTKDITFIALMSAVMCVLGPLSVNIPISPVPISLGILAMLLSVYVLGRNKALFSCFIYILLGAVGVPVFSGFSGGLSKLVGPTGGYIVGYLPLIFIGGVFVAKHKNIWMQVTGLVLGVIVCYALGTAWLAYSAHMTFGKALMAGVIPFIPADAVKIIIAAFLGRTLQSKLKNILN